MFNWFKDKENVTCNKWEYLVVDPSQISADMLNGYGAVGWELIAVMSRKMYFMRALDA